MVTRAGFRKVLHILQLSAQKALLCLLALCKHEKQLIQWGDPPTDQIGTQMVVSRECPDITCCCAFRVTDIIYILLSSFIHDEVQLCRNIIFAHFIKATGEKHEKPTGNLAITV